MEVKLNLSEEQVNNLAAAVVEQMVRDGVAMVEPERAAPYSVTEAAVALSVSEDTVRRYVEAGKLRRVKGMSRVLIPVGEVKRYQEGG